MSTSENSFYSDHQWSILESRGLTGLASFDADTGPTLSQAGGSGDFQAAYRDQLLMSTNSKYAAGGFYDKMMLVSDGLLVTDADQLKIDAYDTGHTVYNHDFYKGLSRHNTEHHQYTGIDASNANGYVTYNGVTKDHWQGETHLTGKSYEFNNLFKGGDHGNKITGGNCADILIGGKGDDTINGVGGENTLYGVGGDNRIDGGSGGSTIFGGTGNDFIVTGKGDNTVILANGENWIVVNPGNAAGATANNMVMLGSGRDTVVVGDLQPSDNATISAMSDWRDGLVKESRTDAGTDFAGWASNALDASNPLWSDMLTAGRDVVSTLVGGTPSDAVGATTTPQYDATEIMNFNPVTDRLLFPMDPEGSNNLTFQLGVEGHDLALYDNDTGAVLAYIDFATAEEVFGTSGALTAAQMQSFGDALLSSVLFMKSDGLVVGSDGGAYNSLSFDASEMEGLGSFSEDLGAGAYLFAGSWAGNHMFGDSSNGTYMGSDQNDVLFGFDITGKSIDADTGGGASFYGFSGDNLFATGTGHNLVFGGSGQDTVTYEYALGGITADMTELALDSNNKSAGEHFTVKQDLDGFHEDYLWNVENIIGSAFDDRIVGNDEDNTFVSTGGTNTWSGTGGDNSFVLNGGSAEITDFTQGDTIMVYKSVYGIRANLAWFEEDDAWTLRNVKKPEVDIVTLDKTDDFDGPAEVTLYRKDGSTVDFTPEAHYAELLSA